MPIEKINACFVRFQSSGNPQDLGQVFDATASELLRVANHLIQDVHLAEDLVQATFLAAIQDRHRYNPEVDAIAWLLGILTNLAHEKRRSLGRIIRGDRLPVKDSGEASAAAEAHELSQSVIEAIAKLPEVYQPVMNLNLRHGLNAAQIAVSLKRPSGTVRTQLVRGLELLRKALPASIIAGSVVLTSPASGLAAMRELVVAKATAVTAKASFTLALGKLTLWTAAGALTAAAVAVTFFVPDVGQVTFDELSPQATASVVAQKGPVDFPAIASAALQADPFSPSSRVLMTFYNPVPHAPGGASTMNANKTPPSSLSQNMGVFPEHGRPSPAAGGPCPAPDRGPESERDLCLRWQERA